MNTQCVARRLVDWLRAAAFVGISLFTVTALEGATVHWTGAAGDDAWHNPVNWDGGTVPGPDDDASISLEGATVEFSQDADPVRSLTLSQQLTVSGGTLSISNSVASSAATLVLDGGSLDFAGTATMNGSLVVLRDGTVSEGFRMAGGGVDFGADSTASGTIGMRGQTTLAGNIPAGMVVRVEGSTANGQAHLTLPASVTNHGTIILETVTDDAFDRSAFLTISTGVLVNAATGVIRANVGEGDGRRITGDVENHGTVVVEAGMTLTVVGADHLFAQRDGVVQADGELLSDGGRFDFTGGALTGTVRARNAFLTVADTVNSASTLRAVGPSGVFGGNESAGVTVWMEGTMSHGQSRLSVTNAVTNHGRLLLSTSSDDAFERGCYLEIDEGGFLENSESGIIEFQTGEGDARSITGHLRNRGRILVEPGETADFIGRLEAAGGTFEGEFYVRGSDVEATVAPVEPTTLLLVGPSNSLLTGTPEDLTLWLRGGVTHGWSILTAPQGFTNHGTILLECASNDAFDRGAYLNVTTGELVNASGGLIRANAGAGDPRVITASLENHGTILVESHITLNLRGVGRRFGQRGGVLEADGEFLSDASAFEFTGGAVSGVVRARNAYVLVSEGVTDAGLVRVVGPNNILGGNRSPVVTLWQEGSVDHGWSILTVTNEVLNAGRILMETVSNDAFDRGCHLTVAEGGLLEIGVEGVIEIQEGAGDPRRIVGAVRHRGLILVGSGETAEFRGALEMAGGACEGDLYLLASDLSVTDPPSAPSALLLVSGSNRLLTDVAEGLTLTVQGSVGSGRSILTLPEGGTNHGTIVMTTVTNDAADRGSYLRIGSGSLVNAATGAIRMEAGAGDARHITGAFTNQGVFSVHDVTARIRTGPFVNDASGLLTGTGTFDVGGVIFENLGTVSPGALPGQLAITGDFIQGASGRLNVELGGTEAGVGHDQLAISGAATLDGVLNVSLLDDYEPGVGNVFRTVTFGSVSGEFAGHSGLILFTNLSLEPDYQPTALDLVAVAATNVIVDPPGIISQPASQTIVNGQTAVFRVTANGTRPFGYQWFFNGTNAVETGESTLTLANAQTNQSGAYHVVITNSAGSVTSAVATLTVRPVADLVISDVTNPDDAIAGQPVTLTWRSANAGNQTALAPWTESVSLSTNATGEPAIPVATIQFHETLPAGESLVRTQTVITPGGLDDLYYVVVRTDTSDRVAEEDNEANNTTVAGERMRLRSPDLAAGEVELSAGSALFGEALTVSWTVTNAGSASVSFPWEDGIHLGTNSQSLAGAVELGTFELTSVPLAEAGVVTNHLEFILPLSTELPPGDYFVLVSADHGGAISESDEENNLAAAPLMLTLPPLPDLVPGGLVAPANAMSGQPVTLSWSVTNSGSMELAGVRSETVFLATNELGEGLVELGTLVFSNVVAAGASVTRTQSVVVPVTSPLGEVWFAVLADSRDDVVEENEANNFVIATNALAIPALLTLQLPSFQMTEGSPQALPASVTRNGDRSQELAVTLENSDPGELEITGSVVIPAGQASASFPILALSDGVVDGARVVELGAHAEGFTPAFAFITVMDADLPQLDVSFATNAVTEGFQVSGTITRNSGTNAPVTVTVTSSAPTQLLGSGTVTLPEGAFSGDFTVVALNDLLIEGPAAYTLSVSAPGHIGDSAEVTVVDDDTPVVIVDVREDVVREDAGPQAALVTITRAPVSPRDLELELESSDPGSLMVPARVTLPGGETAITIPAAAVDNDLVDGSREVEIRVWITATGSSLRLAEGTPDTVTVTDDDGPALSVVIDRDLVAEGLEPAATATVTRNDDVAGALEVTLLSSDLTEVTVPASVTIPAGEASVMFDLVTHDDGIMDGSQSAVIAASGTGYASGQARITVSDLSLADLVVASVSSPGAGETEAFVNLGYTLRNQGLALMASNSVAQRLSLSTDSLLGGDIPLGEFLYSGSLPPGDQISQTFQIRLPQAAGDYWLVVETDVDGILPEILEDNNIAIATQPIRVSAEYEAEVSTTVESAPSNTRVPLTGRAFRPSTGGPAPFVLVNIHIRLRGTERIISALTDAAGEFATSWQPLPGEAGFYEIAASHPGTADPVAQDSFSLFGLKTVPSAPEVAIVEGGSVGGVIELINAGDETLTGLSVEVLSRPDNLDVTMNLQSQVVAGLATNHLSYSIGAIDSSVTTGEVVARVSSAEGAVLDIPFGVTVERQVPQLVAVPATVVAGMKRGAQTMVHFHLANLGGTNSGPIFVSLPPAPWMHLASPNPLPAIEPGETNVVTLQLMPESDIELTLFTGNLLMTAGGTTLSVPFEFRALSEATGDLKVTSVDEFTYFAEGSPPLTHAAVVVRDAVTKTAVTNGVTDASGEWFAGGLQEGYYEIEVTAEDHTDYRVTHLLHSGRTNEVMAFLSRQTVRYTWTVEQTEIEDRYRITIETEFEANVPAPVVTVDPPVIDVGDMVAVGQVKQVNLTIRNHGLIGVDDARLGFSTHPFYEIVPLINDIGRIGARASLTIPVTVRRIGDFGVLAGGADAVTAAASGGCGMSGSLSFRFECGPNSVGGGAPIGVSGAQNTGGCGGGGALGPGGGGAGYAGGGFATKITCNPRCLALAALGCVPGPVGCFFGGFACGEGLAQGVNPLSILDCAMGAASCMVPGAGIPACYYAVARCFASPAGSGGPGTGDSGNPPVTAASSEDLLDAMSPGVRAMLDAFNEITGAEDGVWVSTESGPATGDWFALFQVMTAPQSDGERSITSAERTALLSGIQPPGVDAEEVNRFLDRWNRTLENYDQGIVSRDDAPPGANLDFIDAEVLRQLLVLAAEYQTLAEDLGFTDPVNAIVETVRFLDAQGEEGGVCAQVRLRIDQDAVISREAFRATLEFENEDAAALENIGVDIRVTDEAGNDVTSLFGIEAPELTNISDVAGGGSVPMGSSATARWTLVPTVDAAPVEPLEYFVTGEFTYTLDGVLVTIPLTPVGITVHPTPLLTVRYFHERSVYSDDPHTDAIEPGMPFNLAVMVENDGAGAANDFQITSAQPEIVENEKGLLIDFKIIATEVAGENLTPSLTAEFGTIAPHDTAIARWLMTSTLQGLFIDYSATFEHVDGLGDPRLSVIDTVEIHELIHLVNAGGVFEDGKPDFLVNDVPDLRDFPDTLWLSDGSTHFVEAVTNAVTDGSVTAGDPEVELAAAMPGGWTYLRVPDPADGQFQLASVTRSDGTPIELNVNVWITDRTFYGLGKRPARENILHLLDYNSTGSYTLVYEPNPAADFDPPSSAVAALPAASRAHIPVSWSGQDNTGGQGIAFYDVYVSEDAGAFQRWLWGTLDTESIYQGRLGHDYAFYSVAVDRAGNRETAPVSPDARTSVTITNHPPEFGALADVALEEGETLSMIIPAEDPDGDELTFSLMPGAPSGMVLNPYSGLLTWVTGEAHGPGTHPVTVQVLDNGAPRFGVFGSFNVLVTDDNAPPELEAIADQVLGEGQLLVITNVAMDFDVPAQGLTYSLGPGAPDGVAIDALTGVLSWRPTDIQGGTTHGITVIVTDDGEPPASASRTFAVVVRDTRPDLTLAFGSMHLESGAAGVLPLMFQSGLDLTRVELVFTIDGSALGSVDLRNPAPEVGSVEFQELEANRFRAQFDSGAGGYLQGELRLAELAFDTASNGESEIVRIRAETFIGEPEAAPSPVEGRTDVGRVFVVGEEPILDVMPGTNGNVVLALYAMPDRRYALEAASDLGGAGFSFAGWVDASELRTELPARHMTGRMEFFRATVAPATAGLTILMENGEVILEWPESCVGCVLMEGSGLDAGAGWSDSVVQPQLIEGRYRVSVSLGQGTRFYRLDPP